MPPPRENFTNAYRYLEHFGVFKSRNGSIVFILKYAICLTLTDVKT